MAAKRLSTTPHGDALIALYKNPILDKKEFKQTAKRMAIILAYCCDQKILDMQANRKIKSDMSMHYSELAGIYHKNRKIFWKGVPELNIESPFEIVKKLLEDKGYILTPRYNFFHGTLDFHIKCKNI